MKNTKLNFYNLIKLATISFVYVFWMAKVEAQVWVPQMSGTNNELNSVWFTTMQKGWIVGDIGTSIFTINTGANWIPVIISNEDMNDVAFKNPLIGLIVGDHGNIFRTSNGGIMWNMIPSGIFSKLNTVAFGDSGNVYAAGEEGIILKSTNNGINWIKIDSMADDDMKSINSSFASGTSFAIFVGDGGSILVTTNGGTSFSTKNSGTDRDLRTVFFLNDSTGYTGGKERTLLFTMNGGNNWISRTNGLDVDSGEVEINGIFFVSTMIGYSVGDHGAIFRTSDAGMTWMSEISQTMEDLHHVFFSDADHGWAVGDEGTIRFRGNTTGIIRQTETATKYRLEQNYPNPFNPSTKIKFALPADNFVNITIYDLTGKSIATLVNSNLKAGAYEINFDASKYSSGIYFYRLTSSGFTDTRKMILIK